MNLNFRTILTDIFLNILLQQCKRSKTLRVLDDRTKKNVRKEKMTGKWDKYLTLGTYPLIRLLGKLSNERVGSVE